MTGARPALKINGKATHDSSSPVLIFTIGELKLSVGTQAVQLMPIGPDDDQFKD